MPYEGGTCHVPGWAGIRQCCVCGAVTLFVVCTRLLSVRYRTAAVEGTTTEPLLLSSWLRRLQHVGGSMTADLGQL